jgi:hypothetical protein
MKVTKRRPADAPPAPEPDRGHVLALVREALRDLARPWPAGQASEAMHELGELFGPAGLYYLQITQRIGATVSAEKMTAHILAQAPGWARSREQIARNCKP